MNSPKTKSLFRVPTNVNGMQRTPRKRSEMAKLRRNTFVIVRILLFCTSVRITSELPITASRKMTAYNGICTLPWASQLAVFVELEVIAVAAVEVLLFINKAAEDDDEEDDAVIALKRLTMETLCEASSPDRSERLGAEELSKDEDDKSVSAVVAVAFVI